MGILGCIAPRSRGEHIDRSSVDFIQLLDGEKPQARFQWQPGVDNIPHGLDAVVLGLAEIHHTVLRTSEQI